LAISKNDDALAAFVMRLVMMALALRMLGFMAPFTAVAAMACQRRTTHREGQHYSED
jgi:hypothetical protein